MLEIAAEKFAIIVEKPKIFLRYIKLNQKTRDKITLKLDFRFRRNDADRSCVMFDLNRKGERVAGRSNDVAVLFADVCDSTKLYTSLDNERASRIVGECLQVLTVIACAHGGSVIKTMGDAVMAEFPTVDQAMNAAVAMQTRRRQGDLPIQIGFDFGAVVRTPADDFGNPADVFGHTVNIAARVAKLARSAEILTTGEAVMHLSAWHRRNAVFFDSTTVKGVSRLISLFRYPTGTDGTIDGLSDGLDRVDERMNGTDRLVGSSARLHLRFMEQAVSLRSDQGGLAIGRDPRCQLVVPGRGVSRQHAKITWERDRFVLEDVSAYGTFVAERGESAHLLKRQVIPLFGEGSISLGVPPPVDGNGGITYSVDQT